MKVGMYNRWLTTLGGGEKYSLTIAQLLSQNHDVHVLSHQLVSREDVAHRFNLDLSKVSMDIIPSRSAIELTPLTGEYDLFLNVSYMDFIPSIARHSASVIYFPAVFDKGRNTRFRYRVGWLVKRWFMVPTIAEGFLRFQNHSLKSKSIESTFSVHIRLPAHITAYQVSFHLSNLHPAVKEACLVLDGRPVEMITFKGVGKFRLVTLEIPASISRIHDLVIEPAGIKADPSAASYFAVSDVVVHTSRFKVFHAVTGNVIGKYGTRFQLLPLPYTHSNIHEAVDTYDAVWAISKFTQRWIKTYWQRDSILLYPPVDVEKFTPAPKKNQILNVGRFFAGNHNKKHLEMIQAFKEMVDAGLKDWEFHLVGGSTRGDIHGKYLADVISEAADYPIFIHPDMPYPEMLKLYNESAIYWHASGFGEDENREPVKFEHFGITTVEGMAAGCVPVVIGKGGQPEIVRHGQNGYLWYTIDELKKFTGNLIVNPELRRSLSAAAISDSQNYSGEKFRSNLIHHLAKIGVDL